MWHTTHEHSHNVCLRGRAKLEAITYARILLWCWLAWQCFTSELQEWLLSIENRCCKLDVLPDQSAFLSILENCASNHMINQWLDHGSIHMSHSERSFAKKLISGICGI